MSLPYGAYVHFCDDNDLERIDATPEQHMENIDTMIAAMKELKELYRPKFQPFYHVVMADGTKLKQELTTWEDKP